MGSSKKIKESRRVKFLITFVSVLLIVFMFPQGESLESEVAVNSIWLHDDLIASMPFEILRSSDEYEKDKKKAADAVHPIFSKTNLVESIIDSLKKGNNRLLQMLDSDILLNTPGKNTFLTKETYVIFKDLRHKENLLSSRRSKSMRQIFDESEEIIRRIYRRGLLDVEIGMLEKDTISVREGKYQKSYPAINYYDKISVVEFISARLKNYFSNDDNLNQAVKEYITFYITPNLTYKKELTEEARLISIDRVPKNNGIVNENERIVSKNDKITSEIKAKIDSYRIAKGAEIGFWGSFMQNSGKMLHIIMILLPFIVYIFLFRKKIFYDNYKVLLLCLIVLLISFITFILSSIDVDSPVQYLILVPVASMLITILFDSRIGFYSTVIISLIIAGIRGNDYVLAVTNVVAGGLAAYTVRDIKNRNQIFRSFLFILGGYAGSIIAFGLERFDSIQQILVNIAFATSNSVISPALTFGLIIFIEKSFKITTDLTLLELSDFNTPLLKELAGNAPGTFTHSMTLGTMVETAANEIGANPILARVGAYYHDIGKTTNPEGFVENQMDNHNVHDTLAPEHSVELIVDHVRRGMDLAKKHKLPQEVIDFIPMHHGTMAISFFYEKAKKALGEDNVDINDFRYPGPKPNTKETALLMLADACESAVRAMSEPDANKIENMINNLTRIRVNDGQLDEAPITFSDITKIKEAYLNVLLSQHHKRIRYPKQEELENKSELS